MQLLSYSDGWLWQMHRACTRVEAPASGLHIWHCSCAAPHWQRNLELVWDHHRRHTPTAGRKVLVLNLQYSQSTGTIISKAHALRPSHLDEMTSKAPPQLQLATLRLACLQQHDIHDVVHNLGTSSQGYVSAWQMAKYVFCGQQGPYGKLVCCASDKGYNCEMCMRLLYEFFPEESVSANKSVMNGWWDAYKMPRNRRDMGCVLSPWLNT